MKVYVAGPMTGLSEYNAPAFRTAKKRLEAMGHEVRTPFEANTAVWQRHHGVDFDPKSHRCEYGDPKLCEMFAEDIAYLLWADAIALLPGWANSNGVKVELAVANLFKKKLLSAISGEEISVGVRVEVWPVEVPQRV